MFLPESTAIQMHILFFHFTRAQSYHISYDLRLSIFKNETLKSCLRVLHVWQSLKIGQILPVVVRQGQNMEVS